jgi:hypothetical protein
MPLSHRHHGQDRRDRVQQEVRRRPDRPQHRARVQRAEERGHPDRAADQRGRRGQRHVLDDVQALGDDRGVQAAAPTLSLTGRKRPQGRQARQEDDVADEVEQLLPQSNVTTDRQGIPTSHAPRSQERLTARVQDPRRHLDPVLDEVQRLEPETAHRRHDQDRSPLLRSTPPHPDQPEHASREHSQREHVLPPSLSSRDRARSPTRTSHRA